MECERCKTKNNLYKKGFSSNGRIRYLCCSCNTETVRKYRQTKKGKKNTLKAVFKSIKKYRYKQDSRIKLNYELRKGTILKPNKCTECLETKIIEGHHFDYSKPLEVIWLCRTCHSKLHKLSI